MLEGAMARQLCARITDRQIAELRAHLRDEAAAVSRTDVAGRTRLLADFHVVLARMLGNEVLAELLADLLSRSSLIALMYQSSHSAEHSQARTCADRRRARSARCAPAAPADGAPPRRRREEPAARPAARSTWPPRCAPRPEQP